MLFVQMQEALSSKPHRLFCFYFDQPRSGDFMLSLRLLIRRYATAMASPMQAGASPPTSKILPCDPSSITFPESSNDSVPQISDAATEANLHKAAAYLKQGRLVAFPTETVYGLGGSAMADSDAIPKIFATKGRPSDNPLIVHIASRSQLDSLIDPKYKQTLPRCYSALMDKFWPGPLTLLFPTIPGRQVSEKVTCGLKTVGIRMPSHPVARALLAISNLPLAAPSANTSGRPSTTQARHVDSDLVGKEEPACILDGGECKVGVESTVITALSDASHHNDGKEVLRVLRLGGVSPEDLQRCIDQAGLGNSVVVKMEAYTPSNILPSSSTNGHTIKDKSFIPSTPGMKYKHYSPDARVILLKTSVGPSAQSLDDILARQKGKRVGALCLEGSAMATAIKKSFPTVQCISMGIEGEYEEQAARLFSGLRALDEAKVDVILVETVKEEGLGRTVMERLRKSAGAGNPEVDVKLT